MQRIRFVGGQRLLLRGMPITLVRSSGSAFDEMWEIENRAKRQTETIARRDLDIALLKNELLDDSNTPPPPRKYIGARLLSDLPEPARRRVYFEREIIREVQLRVWQGYKACRDKNTGRLRLADILDELSDMLGNKHFGRRKNVSVTTYYSYCKKHRQATAPDECAGGYERRGRREQMGVGVREASLRAIEEAIQEYKGKCDKPGKTLLSRRVLERRIVAAIEKLRVERPGDDLRVPSVSTYYRLLREVDQYDLLVAMKGRVQANAEFRAPGKSRRQLDYPLQWCQFDETRCPIFLYHKIIGIPLGKPWLAWIIDVYSGGILGFYLGFEPPGDSVVAQTLRHACLPKTYMEDMYPGIEQPLIMAGIPKLLTFDNSLQAHGNSIMQICGDLDIQYDFTRSRCPWMKSMVENMFKTLEQELLRHQPGYTFPPFWKINRADYDPEKTALLDFDMFLGLIHAWLAMHVHPRSTGKRPAPNYLWLEGIRKVEPEFVANTADLDALFGIVRKGSRLDSCGLSFSGLIYYSDDLHWQRLKHGARQKIDIKCNPLDIRRIHFRACDGSWLPAETREHPEFERLDLHVVQLLNAQSKREYGRETPETRVQTFGRLQDALEVGYDEGMAAANAARAARILGIGSHNVLLRQGHDGQIDLSAKDCAVSPENFENIPQDPAPDRPRSIPSFRTDDSLERRR
jgi:putative transposase